MESNRVWRRSRPRHRGREAGREAKRETYMNAPRKGKIIIYVCGILTWPGKHRNWTGRAVTHTMTCQPYKAEKVEYFVGALSRPIGESYRARKLISTLRQYEGWEIHLVAHSNGCDVVVDTLRLD